MQQALVATFRELGLHAQAERVAARKTDGLICGLVPFPWASSLDMIWHHNATAGAFHGNLDRGLTEADLQAVRDTPVRTLLERGLDVIAANT